VAPEELPHSLPATCHIVEARGETVYCRTCGTQQLSHLLIPLGVGTVSPAGNRIEAMMQGVFEKPQAARVVEEVVFEIGIAFDNPNVTENFVQHTGRSTGTALTSQLFDDIPRLGPQ
jgi:hypothetical protein